jgi:hypothetical protein
LAKDHLTKSIESGNMSLFSTYVVNPVTHLLGRRRRRTTPSSDVSDAASMFPPLPSRDDDVEGQPPSRRARMDDVEVVFTIAVDDHQDPAENHSTDSEETNMSLFSTYVVAPITRLLGKRRRTPAASSASTFPPRDDVEGQPVSRRARVDDVNPVLIATTEAAAVEDVQMNQDSANTSTWRSKIGNSFTRSYSENPYLWDFCFHAFILGVPLSVYSLALANGFGHSAALDFGFFSNLLAGSACDGLISLGEYSTNHQ